MELADQEETVGGPRGALEHLAFVVRSVGDLGLGREALDLVLAVAEVFEVAVVQVLDRVAGSQCCAC